MDIILNTGFENELDNGQLLLIEGGTFWGVVSGVFTVAGGVATAVGGAALLAAPDPTLATKVAGWGAIGAGGATVIGGIAIIGVNL